MITRLRDTFLGLTLSVLSESRIISFVVVELRLLGPGMRDLSVAASLIKGGGLVAFPTETVYGLGGLGFSADSVTKIFRVKDRSPDVPLILHVSSLRMFEECIDGVPEVAYELVRRFWPGPLTLVLPKSHKVPEVVTAGRVTVGVRWPSHEVTQKLIDLVGEPLAAPSANRFMSLPPLTAGDVVIELDDLIDAVVDGGEVPLGVESTVIDLSVRPFRVLRPGSLPVPKLEAFLSEEVIRAYGMPSRKYRLGVEVVYVRSCSLGMMTDVVDSVADVVGRLGSGGVLVLGSDETLRDYFDRGIEAVSLGSRRKPFEVGKGFIRVLRSLPSRVRKVVIEPFPCGGVWEALDYRFLKAARKVVEA